MPETFFQVWTTHQTRHEGGNATHLSLDGDPLCGASSRLFHLWDAGSDRQVDQSAPWKATDCGNCQRIAKNRLRAKRAS